MQPQRRISGRTSAALAVSTLLHAAAVLLLVSRGAKLSATPYVSVSGAADLLQVVEVSNWARPVAPNGALALTKRTIINPQPIVSGAATESNSSLESNTVVDSDDSVAGLNSTSIEKPIAGTARPASNEMSRYIGLLATVLQENRRYPREAIAREEEGVVGLVVKLGSNGDLVEARVKDPSSFSSLNEAALKTILSIQHYPKPPIAEGSVIELAIPMRFKIERL